MLSIMRYHSRAVNPALSSTVDLLSGRAAASYLSDVWKA